MCILFILFLRKDPAIFMTARGPNQKEHMPQKME